MQYQRVKTRAVHCHCDDYSAAGGHFARCGTSWICLQHHATVVTSHGVTVCGSQFPPTISKHCPQQRSAIHKTIQQYAVPTIPTVVISKLLLPQSNIMAAFVHSHCSLFSDDSPCLPTYSNHKVTLHIVLFSTVNSCCSLRLPPKLSNYQLQQYF